MVRIAGSQVVAVRVLIPGGVRREGLPGMAYLTGRMLAEGTRRRDWRRLSEEIEARGMILRATGGYEAHGFSLDGLASDWRLALEWAAELLAEPAFPGDRLEWLCRQTVAELESLADQPEVRTAWAFLEQLYAPHPRARKLQGDPASLAAASPELCAAFHARGLARGPIVVVAGEIDEEAVDRRLEELLGGLAGLDAGSPGEEGPHPPPLYGSPDHPRRQRVELPPPAAAPDADEEGETAAQAHLYLGHLTVPRDHPDLPALDLAAVILGAGSGLAGRIPTRVREEEGLAYSASVQTAAGAGIDPGRLVVYIGTAPGTVEQAERSVRQELERLLADGVEQAELDDARSYLLGRDPFRRETARQQAELLAEAAFYGNRADDPEHHRRQLLAVDRRRLQAALREHLAPEELRVTVGVPAAGDETVRPA